ncbi:MAG TPA: TIM barrel protein [Acidimicrobiia bacterium]|nr:TIM barrel protein [Acidimicrobiia bacterium]
MTARPLGVVDVVYGSATSPPDAARLAAADGFAHIDVRVDVEPATLALPVGCPIAFPKPIPGWCATPAPTRAPGMWERAVRWWRAAPGALLEPWAGAVVHSAATVRAFLAEVPGTRLLVDTGHVADWGGDPCELLELADHVQLRQGAPGHTQLHVDDPAGVVDFAAVLARLDALDYAGKLSVEYFDLPEHGWPCAEPRAWALDLARRVRGTPATA